MVKYIRNLISNFVPIKIVFYLAALLFGMPILSLLYWAFDSSYLAAFGVGPELYTRPLFSSSFINIWLCVAALKPGLWLWLALAILLFFILFMSAYEWHKSDAQHDNCIVAEEQSVLDKIYSASGKAFTPAVVFYFSGMLAILAIAWITKFLADNAAELAQKQIQTYRATGECKDAFNNSHSGCYTISNEDGDDHLLILNSKETLVFITRSIQKPQKSENNTPHPELVVVVKNKITQEKIARKFVYLENKNNSK